MFTLEARPIRPPLNKTGIFEFAPRHYLQEVEVAEMLTLTVLDTAIDALRHFETG